MHVDEGLSDIDNESMRKIIKSQTEVKRGILRIILLGAVGVGCVLGMYYLHIGWTAVAGALTFLVVSWYSDRSSVTDRHTASKKGIVITGCDTGFGHSLAKHLDNIGATVFAGCLDATGEGATSLKKSGSSRLHVVQMDVTNPTDVQYCVNYVEEKLGKPELWGLVNNAGLNFLGDIELTTMDQFEKVVNVNQLGAIRVTKAFLPLIRKRKGRIVNVTSVKGRFAEAFNAPYGMTKFAMECFSDALRQEIAKFGVNVSIIEPGNFGGATGCLNMDRIKGDFDQMWESATEEAKNIYGKDYLSDHIKNIYSAIPTASFNIQPVIDGMTDALLGFKPQHRYLIPGGSGMYDIYKWRIFLYPFLPTWLMDKWLLSDHRLKLPPRGLR